MKGIIGLLTYKMSVYINICKERYLSSIVNSRGGGSAEKQKWIFLKISILEKDHLLMEVNCLLGKIPKLLLAMIA